MSLTSDYRANPLLAIRRIYSQKKRVARAKLFRDLFPRLSNEKVLDLGGGKGEHIAMVLPGFRNITVADYSEEHLDIARKRFGYQCVRIDGAEKLAFQDREFDIVYCNSVIEHVTGPRDIILRLRDKKRFEEIAWRHQKAFADEIRRIGTGYFVQTPYKWFPVESHTITPFFVQVFPRWLQLACYKLVPKKKTEPDFHLLTIRRMKELFPDAKIVLERSFGMVKSIIAVKTA